MNKIFKIIKPKQIIKFILFELIFLIITMLILIFYGPFSNVRNTIVKSSMTSMKHKWVANMFLSDEKINEIMNQDILTEIKQNRENDFIENTTKDSNGDIELYDIKGDRYQGKLLIIDNPKKVKVGYTNKLGKEGQTTSEIAKQYDALAAINGGGFKGSAEGISWTGTGAIPRGIIMSDGKIIFNEYINNNEKVDIMGLTKEGYLLVGKYNLNELKELRAKEVISFGPPLIVNGDKTIRKGDGGWGIAPRTAIAQRKDGAIILLVIDGRRVDCIGATLKDIQDILYDFGAYNAINLDGGFSSTMYYDGEVINKPPDILGERSVPSIVYIEK